MSKDGNGKIRLNKDQVAFIMEKTGSNTLQEAVEYMAELMMQERVNPAKMPSYIAKMMQKENKK
jgi:hypothetical protein